jgi:transcriptional regulator with XRE-family HTH domain
MDVRELVADNLKRIRQDQGVSQESLADAAGIDRTYVSSIERRVYSVSIDKLAAIAAALGVKPYQLLLPLDHPERGS